jgi:hypothetical protein
VDGEQQGEGSEPEVDPDVPGTGDVGDETLVVRRDAARASSDAARRRRMAIIGAVVAVLVLIGVGVAVALSGGDDDETAVSTTTASTTTEAPTTTVAVPTAPVAPLTGLQVPDGDADALARLDRPALVGKIDNAPEAMPQIGIDRADVVIELKVEGISRYMAVVHSQEVAELGPIRSARTSDPDLLAMFVRPLVAWSGGNPTVTRIMDRTPWIQSLNPDQTTGAYSRTSTKRPPHNLVADVPRLYTYADQPPAVPVPLFEYLPEGTPPGGSPVPGLELSVGSSPSTWVWSAERGVWLRWANGRRQTVESGEQISAANVVVLATPYGTSAADRISPEAVTTGFNTAWIFTQGQLIEGAWARSEPSQPWQLQRADGTPIQLTPGNTWVELPSPDDPPRVLDPAAAERLLAG